MSDGGAELWAALVTHHSWNVLESFFGVYLVTAHTETFTSLLLSLFISDLYCYIPASELSFKCQDVLI